MRQAIQASLEEAQKAGIPVLASPARPPQRSPLKEVVTSPQRQAAAVTAASPASAKPRPAPAPSPRRAPAIDVSDDDQEPEAGATQPVPDAAPSPRTATAHAAAAEPSVSNSEIVEILDGEEEDAIGLDKYTSVCCQLCNSCEGADDSFVLCDGCDAWGVHLVCAGLGAVPDGDWDCQRCLADPLKQAEKADRQRKREEEEREAAERQQQKKKVRARGASLLFSFFSVLG